MSNVAPDLLGESGDNAGGLGRSQSRAVCN